NVFFLAAVLGRGKAGFQLSHFPFPMVTTFQLASAFNHKPLRLHENSGPTRSSSPGADSICCQLYGESATKKRVRAAACVSRPEELQRAGNASGIQLMIEELDCGE